jgi:hypothetical protein
VLAMEASRQQLHSYRANQGPKPVLEEFIPLKHPSSEGSEKAINASDKANWMTSAQLWSQAGEETKQQSPVTSPKESDIGFGVNLKQALENKPRNGGAFLPFSKDRNSCGSQALRELPELALASSPDKEMEDKKNPESDMRRESSCRVMNNGTAVIEQAKGPDCQTNTTANGTTTTQTHRKARRCWSPDLHRRFVNALQMLGGSQGNFELI